MSKKKKLIIEILYFLLLSGMTISTFAHGLIFQIFIDSINVLYMFYTMMFFLASLISGILYKVARSNCKEDCERRQFDLTRPLLAFLAWFLLLCGTSYSFYIIEDLKAPFALLGTITDGFVSLSIVILFIKIFGILNKNMGGVKK